MSDFSNWVDSSEKDPFGDLRDLSVRLRREAKSQGGETKSVESVSATPPAIDSGGPGAVESQPLLPILRQLEARIAEKLCACSDAIAVHGHGRLGFREEGVIRFDEIILSCAYELHVQISEVAEELLDARVIERLEVLCEERISAVREHTQAFISGNSAIQEADIGRTHARLESSETIDEGVCIALAGLVTEAKRSPRDPGIPDTGCYMLSYTSEYFAEMLQQEGARLITLRDEREGIVGFMLYIEPSGVSEEVRSVFDQFGVHAYLSHAAIDPAYQGGAGHTQMLFAMLIHLQRTGCRAVAAEIAADNRRNLCSAFRKGFEIVSEYKVVYDVTRRTRSFACSSNPDPDESSLKMPFLGVVLPASPELRRRVRESHLTMQGDLSYSSPEEAYRMADRIYRREVEDLFSRSPINTLQSLHKQLARKAELEKILRDELSCLRRLQAEGPSESSVIRRIAKTEKTLRRAQAELRAVEVFLRWLPRRVFWGAPDDMFSMHRREDIRRSPEEKALLRASKGSLFRYADTVRTGIEAASAFDEGEPNWGVPKIFCAGVSDPFKYIRNDK